MANALDYITWRGDLSFEVAPINEVDLFLCTQLIMADFDGIVRGNEEISLKNVADRYFAVYGPDKSKLGVLPAKETLPSLSAMAKSDRFKDIMISRYENCVCHEDTEQFSATVFRFSPDLCAVLYRGTDDYIIGWKEDCNLAVYAEVPAQRDALGYLNSFGKEFEGNIIVAGHSKGGNLAVFAASNAPREIQDRIISVYNFDGPGFPKDFIEKHEGYAKIKDRINTIVSQYSIVGMVMNAPGTVMYSRSVVEGMMAHDGFNWEVEYGHFKREKELSKYSQSFAAVLRDTMEKMTVEERRDFVNALFDILFETGANTLSEFCKLDLTKSINAFNKMTTSKAIKDFSKKFLVAVMSNED